MLIFIEPAINDIEDADERHQRLQEPVLALARWMLMQHTEYGRLTKTTYPSDHPRNLPSGSGGHGRTFKQARSCLADEAEEEPVVGKRQRKMAAKAEWRLKHFHFLSDSYRQKDDTTELG